MSNLGGHDFIRWGNKCRRCGIAYSGQDGWIVTHKECGPQGATIIRETAESPIVLKLWWSGIDLKDQPSVTLTPQAAVNLAIDLLLSARHGMK